MLSTILQAPRKITVEERPDPVSLSPNDAVVRVVASCVCGSDLWGYRGISPVTEPRSMGHEAVGVVVELGANVTSAQVGDFVILPFSYNCGHCQECLAGCPASCQTVTFVGSNDAEGYWSEGAQSSMIRVPYAQASLFPVGLSEEEIEARGLVPHLLTLADVMCTGYHAAVSAGVRPGDVVAVIGDGAVGLSGVIAAKLLGASRIIAFSRHPERTALARKFGATDIIKERGAEAPGAVRDLLGGNLCDAALECVGTKESMDQSLAVVRGGGRVGFVGVPHGAELNVGQMFGQNLTIGGGMASARVYMETLLPRVLDGSITPGDVFDLTLPLTEAAAAYAAMDERRATKVLLRP